MRFHVLSLFSCLLLDYCKFASVITALTAYCVVNVPCSTVRADCKCRSNCLIVGPSFRSSGLRLPSFRMCHFVLFLIVIVFNYILQIIPTRVCCSAGQLSVLILRGLIFVQFLHHTFVAFSRSMHVLHGNCQSYELIDIP